MYLLLGAAVGVFTICGAVFDWDFFMENRRARLFVWMFGRNGARVFYALLGSAFLLGSAVTAISGP